MRKSSKNTPPDPTVRHAVSPFVYAGKCGVRAVTRRGSVSVLSPLLRRRERRSVCRGAGVKIRPLTRPRKSRPRKSLDGPAPASEALAQQLHMNPASTSSHRPPARRAARACPCPASTSRSTPRLPAHPGTLPANKPPLPAGFCVLPAGFGGLPADFLAPPAGFWIVPADFLAAPADFLPLPQTPPPFPPAFYPLPLARQPLPLAPALLPP